MSRAESRRRYNHSAKGKARNSRYRKTAKRRACDHRYNCSLKGKARQAHYCNKPGTRLLRRIIDAQPHHVLRRELNRQGNP